MVRQDKDVNNSHPFRREWVLVAGTLLIILAGVVMRLIALGDHPYGLYQDEAFNGLDTVSVAAFREFIKKRQKTAVIITSHSLSESEKFVERAVFLNNGEKLEDLDIGQIRIKYKSLENRYLQLTADVQSQRNTGTWL